RQCQARKLKRFRFSDCAAVDCAQEIVEQALTRSRIVEHIADERSLRCLLNKIPEPLARCFKTVQKERVDGCVACGQLSRMQIPSLIECVRERTLNVLVMKPPCSMNAV